MLLHLLLLRQVSRPTSGVVAPCDVGLPPGTGCAAGSSDAVRGWKIAMRKYSSLGEGAMINSLDAVDIGDEVLVRVQVECGREEVNNREKQEKDRTRTQPTNNQTHIVDGMKME